MSGVLCDKRSARKKGKLFKVVVKPLKKKQEVEPKMLRFSLCVMRMERASMRTSELMLGFLATKSESSHVRQEKL